MNPFYKISICALLILIFSINADASYSKIYDEKLNNLSITDPRLTIKITQQQLVQAELRGDYERQLVLYFYMAESYSTLTNISKTKEISAKGLQIAKDHNSVRFISEFIALESYVSIYKGDLREGSKQANLALQFAKETDDYRLIATMLSARSQAHLAIENYTLALKDTESALAIFKEYDDRENLNYNYNLLALIYDSLNEYDKAIKYYDVSLSYDDSGSLYNEATMHYNKGTTYSYKGDTKLAIENLKLAMGLSIEINDEATLAYVRYSLAGLYFIDKKYSKAEKLALLAVDWLSGNEDLFMHLNTNLLLAEINIQNLKFIKSKQYLDEVDMQLQSKTISTLRTQLSVLWVKTEYFASQELWKQAYDSSQESLKVRSELYTKDNENSVNEMKLKYDAQFDQEKMASLQKQNQLQQDAIDQEQYKNQYLLGLIALVVLIMMGIYYAYRNQRQIRKNLYLLTIKDDLTQIGNRRYILELLSQLHEKSLEQQQSYSLVMIDLDNFKSINDEYGHYKGNEVLIHFANVAKYTLPENCHVGRLGGEEWLLLLPDHDIEKAEKLLQHLRRNYNNPGLVRLPSDCRLHFSCGIKICDGNCLDVEHTLKRVDKAMYEAKARGRNQDVYC